MIRFGGPVSEDRCDHHFLQRLSMYGKNNPSTPSLASLAFNNLRRMAVWFVERFRITQQFLGMHERAIVFLLATR